jgi:signal peptidase II
MAAQAKPGWLWGPWSRLGLWISYGIGAGTLGQTALAVFALLAALVLSVWLARGANNRLMAGSLGMIIGGAIGNAIDRLHLGGVADFFLLHAFGYSWYVFNIADVAIVAGVIGLLYESFRASRNGAAKRP